MSERERVVILGGGIGGLTAAYELSHPRHEGRYDVTLYQMGWKLGGKGASGRNRDAHDRIEEHGLHVWFRSYVNAIAMMHDVYAEYATLPAGRRSAFRSFDDAFHAEDDYVFEELYDGQWRALPVRMPEYPPPDTPWGEVLQLVEALLGISARIPSGHAPAAPDSAGHPHMRRFFEQALERLAQIGAHGFEVAGLGPHALLEKLHGHMRSLPPPEEHAAAHHRFLIDASKLVDNLAWLALWPFVHHHFELRMAWRALHLGLSCVVGILRDGLVQHGYDVVDDQEYMSWARSHSPLWAVWGRHKSEADDLAFDLGNPFVKPFYDAAFAYEHGDPKRPWIAAGIGMRSCLRLLFQGSGPLAREMNAGMGDTIFSPLYEVLTARGVRIELFQRVLSVEPSADGKRVGSIHLSQQVRFERYEPLFWVKDVQCWPSEPFYEQLDEDPAKLRGHDLGHYDSGWVDTGPKTTLRDGEHFDRVVLGISVACLPVVCPALIERKPAWRTMVDGLATCRTLAAQLWFRPDAQGLGAPTDAPLTGAYVEPLSSIADFSHLIARESWPAADPPGYLAYACGCMKDGAITQPEADARTQELTRALLARHARPLWPRAVDAQGEFDWSVLYPAAPGAADGESLLSTQYFRANIDPTELYVQSAPGSNGVRLRADASGFDNLVLAGTWIDTGMNVSCVETAVISGRQAARAITGEATAIHGESDFR